MKANKPTRHPRKALNLRGEVINVKRQTIMVGPSRKLIGDYTTKSGQFKYRYVQLEQRPFGKIIIH